PAAESLDARGLANCGVAAAAGAGCVGQTRGKPAAVDRTLEDFRQSAAQLGQSWSGLALAGRLDGAARRAAVLDCPGAARHPVSAGAPGLDRAGRTPGRRAVGGIRAGAGATGATGCDTFTCGLEFVFVSSGARGGLDCAGVVP